MSYAQFNGARRLPVRPLTVDEALQYSAFSSIVPPNLGRPRPTLSLSTQFEGRRLMHLSQTCYLYLFPPSPIARPSRPC